MHDTNAPREQSNPLVFLPLVLLALFFVYLFTWLPFEYGRTKGEIEAAYLLPKSDDDGDEVFDHRQLIRPSDELIQLGSRVYAQQCASCHGAEGRGDGTMGLRLAQPPRNFNVEEGWVNGPSTVQMYGSLQAGVGANMPAFGYLNPRQKYAVIHYIHEEFMTAVDVPEPTEEELASLPAAAAGGETISINAYVEPRVPVRLAMRQVAEPAVEARPARRLPLPEGLGKVLYNAQCADCHGPDGQGVRPGRLMDLSQLRRLAQGPSLLEGEGEWARDYEEFRSVIARGAIGGIKPPLATLTEDEVRALHDYTRALRED